MCRRRSRAGARHNVPGWELFGRAQGSNAGRGARGGAFGSGSRKRGRKGAAAFAQGAGACAVTLGKRGLPSSIWALKSAGPGPKTTGTVTKRSRDCKVTISALVDVTMMATAQQITCPSSVQPAPPCLVSVPESSVASGSDVLSSSRRVRRYVDARPKQSFRW